MDSTQKPGWYWQEGLPAGAKRYWDGAQWTEKVSAPPASGATSVAWGIILALVIIGGVGLGLLNFLNQFSK